MLVEHCKNIFASSDSTSGSLPVALDHLHLGFIAFWFFFLLDGRRDTPRRASGTDHLLFIKQVVDAVHEIHYKDNQKPLEKLN